MRVDLNDLKVGDTVRFKNGQVAKVVEIKLENEDKLCLYFNKAVACYTEHNTTSGKDWRYKRNGEIIGLTNHIVEIIMTVDLNDLKIGDSVRFINGQVAKVVDIRDNGRLYFDKKVACDVDDPKIIYDTNWHYDQNGECSGCTNHIVEIMKKGEKTMNKHKIEKSLEWHKRKIAELEEALKQPENKRWFPKKDEHYYGISSYCVEDFDNYSEDYTKAMYSLNNVFKTEEEAEKELSRRKAETELLDMCDWTSEHMFMIFYDRSTSNFDIDYFCAHQFTPYCFASEESARKAIDTLGEEKLKLIFRI